ncbi:hypothetical protein [Pseudomonas baetica]|uniref:hypothetical protein n=1 Tax=Pseudomonas baetica TaxID=674054 RepID=UPI0024054272|nr:hypothetical protein [Pseudomonas baetica]MDF9779203.1 hypothetical protein [Pseudomonas baetica]
MTTTLKSKVIGLFDAVVIAAAKGVWALIKMFDPYPVQHHFVARPSAVNHTVTKLFSLKGDDAKGSFARLCNYHIVSVGNMSTRRGLVGRKGLIKIYNADNGKVLIIRAQGSSVQAGEKGIPKDGIALNYDACKLLGIPKNQEDGLNLVVGPANVNDQEYFHMYQDSDMSSRTARALGWYLLIAGMVYSVSQVLFSGIEIAIGLLS